MGKSPLATRTQSTLVVSPPEVIGIKKLNMEKTWVTYRYIAQCLWRDEFSSPWASKIHAKLLSIGISPIELLNQDLTLARKIINQRLDDIEWQRHLMLGVGLCSPHQLGVISPTHVPPYLSSLSIPSHRFAYIKARFNVFPLNSLFHRFSRGQISALCSCDNRSIETLHHIVFVCPLYCVVRKNLLLPLIHKWPGHPADFRLGFLLQDTDQHVPYFSLYEVHLTIGRT